MRAYDQIMHVIRHHLFAVMPKEYEEQFSEHLYATNVGRFAVQGVVVVLMDLCSLLFYMMMYRATGRYETVHIGMHVVKMLLMGGAGVYCLYQGERGYDPGSFLDRNINVLYPLLHVLLEFCLFLSGPQELGAFLRLLAVPFIIASIPIMPQVKSFFVQLAIYLLYYFYLGWDTRYGSMANHYGYFMNLWIVVFSCAILVAFTVFSWCVRNFIASMKESEVRDELSCANERLDFVAKHDPLTGLANRRGFGLFLEKTWELYRRDGAEITVVMIDIDHFKRYNDRFGHPEGDNCLCKATGAIGKELEGNDYILARYGGEEFIAVAYRRGHEEMVARAERIRKQVLDLKMEHPDSDVSLYVTVSVGVATHCTDELEDYGVLIGWADECLYMAKRTGRNRVVHTCGQQGDYRDIHGASLVVEEDEAEQEREFDGEFTQRIIKEIGANCTFVYDAQLKSLQFTDAAMELYELPAGILVSTTDNLAETMGIALQDQKTFIHSLERCFAAREHIFSMEVHIGKRTVVPVSVSGQCTYGPEGGLTLVFGSIISIAKMVEYNHFLQQQSLVNTVTLLPNRNRLYGDMQGILGEEGSRGYIVFLDIKDFKGINTYYSHSIGDRVLREAARQISRLAAGYTPVYNYDVDQFAIVLRGGGREEGLALMEAVFSHFGAQKALIEGLDLRLEFSIVAVEYSGAGTRADQLFLDLDAAIRMVKYESGQNFAIFDGRKREEYLTRISLGNALKKAVENDFEDFMLYYQPILDAQNKRCVGAEALLRWKNGQGEVVPPGLLIPVLEQSELMSAVEEWIINTACRQCAQWIEDGAGEDFFVNINISAAKIARASTYDEIMQAVYANGLDLRNITLEVTESTATVGRKNAIDNLAALQGQGVRIAIDGFGTGYSSLSYLHSMPANEIKIDRSFVKEIDTNDSAKDVLDSIVSMAKSMGYLVCIEGVEKDSQNAVLFKARIDYLQGFLFGKPSPAGEFFREFVRDGLPVE